MNKRTLLFRIGTVAVLILIGALMMVIGRGHTVYFDNKTIEINGQEYPAANRVEVYVNGERVAKLAKRERGMATNIGQNFKMNLQVTQEKGGETVSHDVSLKLPYNLDGVVINLPAYLAGLSEADYQSEFVPVATAEEPEEEIVTDEFELGEDF